MLDFSRFLTEQRNHNLMLAKLSAVDVRRRGTEVLAARLAPCCGIALHRTGLVTKEDSEDAGAFSITKTYDVYGHLFHDPAKDVDLMGETERGLLAAA